MINTLIRAQRQGINHRCVLAAYRLSFLSKNFLRLLLMGKHVQRIPLHMLTVIGSHTSYPEVITNELAQRAGSFCRLVYRVGGNIFQIRFRDESNLSPGKAWAFLLFRHSFRIQFVSILFSSISPAPPKIKEINN